MLGSRSRLMRCSPLYVVLWNPGSVHHLHQLRRYCGAWGPPIWGFAYQKLVDPLRLWACTYMDLQQSAKRNQIVKDTSTPVGVQGDLDPSDKHLLD